MKVENSEIELSPLDGGHAHEIALSVIETGEAELPDLDLEHSVEAEGVNVWKPLRMAEDIFGAEEFHPSLKAEDGVLLLEYGSTDTTDGLEAVLGKTEDGAEASSKFNPDYLEPLKGKWTLALGTNLPLEARRNVESGEGDWTADITVGVAPRVETEDGD